VSGVWARSGDLSIVRTKAIDLDEAPALRQALADGIERGFEGNLPEFPAGTEQYLLRAHFVDVGMLALVRDCPTPGTVAVVALAIDPAWRGSALATKALLAAERRLQQEGIDRLVTRVPRTNGRGLYFMLRSGFTPLQELTRDGATWFARGGRN
jgi:GNAT superfamily N-acetyltransferase